VGGQATPVDLLHRGQRQGVDDADPLRELVARQRWFEERAGAEMLNEDGKKLDAPSFGERINQMLFGSSIANRTKNK